jgi:hypothetical protein
MLQYHHLTPSQRKWVDLVQLHFPNIVHEITFRQVQEIHQFFLAKRQENKKYKVGMPLWLITHNAIKKGVYFFPVSMYNNTLESITKTEAQFRDELVKSGLLDSFLNPPPNDETK